MRIIHIVSLMIGVKIFAIADNPSPKQDLAFTWEAQIRPWVQGVCSLTRPTLLIRSMGEGGSHEDLLAFYEGKNGNKIFAWARAREITAQSIYNMYQFNVGKPIPQIPVELRSGTIPKKVYDHLFRISDEFIKLKPKSWDDMLSTGHAGDLFVYNGSTFHLFQGPEAPKSESIIIGLQNLLESFRKSVHLITSYKVFEFPQTEQMTQWRFGQALLNGNEELAIYLLSIGANPNKDPRFFESPLEQAILRGKKTLFYTLITLGANTSSTTSDGINLIEYANKHNCKWAIEILKINENNNTQTPK